jgi:hypothetical protein
MRILEYIGLDRSRFAEPYRKVTEAIARGDFRAADVKKLGNGGRAKFYRAKLGVSDRLLFCLVRHRDEVCALMLELIENHDYAKSRFLRGARIDEAKIVDANATDATAEAEPLRYLHGERTSIHVLDKPISFDDAQEAIYRLPPPLIVVGSAGSGKTALTLEKLKQAEGETLYVTQSAYLARNARDLYHADGFERDDQDALFLSYREFVESLRVPAGREAAWRDFSAWFARLRQGQAFRGVEAHQAFEEIRGVIAARAGGALSRDEYRALGVRQSIFPEPERDRLYDLFEKYRAWLPEAKLYDLNLIAHEWRALAVPRFDFVVVDEVQDLTTAQLALVLATLKRPGAFLLCGDSNQIVHPNFFSWSQVKTLFWSDPDLADRQQLHVLSANFRNSPEAARLANTLLEIKQQRFGSIDRESNFLVRAVGSEPGRVALLSDTDAAKRELNDKTRRSTQFAVLVMRDEDKAEARKHFATPLLFSIHEAKGLEYENIVLYRFVSGHRSEFAEVVEGVARESLGRDALEYRRARDKSDKAGEIYKFFVNALYVALTRAVRNLYIVESDTRHPLFGLLGLTAASAAKVEAQRSSLEDWQKEARKLELQGKQEQADAIRSSILRQKLPPWPVLDETNVREGLVKVFRDRVPGDRLKRKLQEYAAWNDEPVLAYWLAADAQLGTTHGFAVRGFDEQRTALWRKYLAPWSTVRLKDALRQCDEFGVEHRTPANQTPLMAAAGAGNVALVDALLERGADPEATDHYGCNALHAGMREAFRDPAFAQGVFPQLYELLAPAAVDVKTGERLVRIDRRLSEYFLFQTMWTLFKSRFTHPGRSYPAFDTATILRAWEHMPARVVRIERNRRAHLSGVLSRNEADRDYAWNRALFKRVRQGWYQFNPALAVRVRAGAEDSWRPVFLALNLPLIGEFALDFQWSFVRNLLAIAQLPEWAVPIAAERTVARREAEQRALQAERDAHEREARERQAARAATLSARARLRAAFAPEPAETDVDVEPKWGTREARRLERKRLQRRIEENRRRRDEPQS